MLRRRFSRPETRNTVRGEEWEIPSSASGGGAGASQQRPRRSGSFPAAAQEEEHGLPSRAQEEQVLQTSHKCFEHDASPLAKSKALTLGSKCAPVRQRYLNIKKTPKTTGFYRFFELACCSGRESVRAMPQGFIVSKHERFGRGSLVSLVALPGSSTEESFPRMLQTSHECFEHDGPTLAKSKTLALGSVSRLGIGLQRARI